MSAPKRNVAYTKPGDPSFLKAFKERVGYKAPDTIEAKRTHRPDPDDREDREDREDEQPTVVVLRSGDLTKEEVDKETKQTKGKEPADGKIVFKKPEKKRKTEDSSGGGMDASTKRTKSDKPVRRNSTSKKVKNTNLLSFDEENDETFD
ncbi:uncharacterized protein KIAA1143 homolog isoform X3 [Dysidea avara]|uniref:uncharacterized protein KIAA1143 homolog isoform X3 n=1 Tax=Dysidea avara TaxID=196820 RepID=UPI00332F029B